jgi:translation initiation factor 2 beta subunit (eIF-2beta)/eIF-5
MNGDQTDPFYRYKMDAVIIQSCKNANIFMNANIIAKQLNRNLCDIIKYMRSTFGANIYIKNKIDIVLPSSITTHMLQDIIFEYINKHIICTKCGNPETNRVGTQKKCISCGFTENIN